MLAPDETTFEYLKGRPHAPEGELWDQAVAYWKTLKTDDDAVFDKVVDIDAGHLDGELTQVSPTGANDVYHIRFADGKERLIPAIPQVVLEVDLDGGVMKIRPLEGLFDDED